MDLFSDVLGMLEETSCDMNHFFYRLGRTPLFTYTTKPEYAAAAEHILPTETETSKRSAISILATFLETRLRPRLEQEGSTNDTERAARSGKWNPKFVLRQWVLEEVIRRTESESGFGVRDKKVLEMVLRMALEPFSETWGFNTEEEGKFCGDVPKTDRGFQCSCSS